MRSVKALRVRSGAMMYAVAEEKYGRKKALAALV
jgi:hypothetical protein